MPLPNIVILISGRGSNMQQLVKATQSGVLAINIRAIVSDQAGASGLSWAMSQQLYTAVLDSNKRNLLEKQLDDLLVQLKTDWVLMAGFMRILSSTFVERWKGKLINIHPSLLPALPGLNTHQRALDSGITEHGASVHFVLPEVDAGPVIMQAKLNITAEHTTDSLAQAVLGLEHQLYPQAIRLLINQDIELYDDQRITVQGCPLNAPMLLNHQPS